MKKLVYLSALLIMAGATACQQAPSSKLLNGSWVRPNPINAEEVEGFMLNEDGTASSINMATLLYKGWEMKDSTLMLQYESIGNKVTCTGTDTLHIAKLTNDSLVLRKNGYVIWQLTREKK